MWNPSSGAPVDSVACDHVPPVRCATLDLLRHVFGDELGGQQGLAHLLDGHVNGALGQVVQPGLETLDFHAPAADHQAGTGAVGRDVHGAARAPDVDARDAGNR